MFADRIDAGSRLAEALAVHRAVPGIAVFGIPRGGVIVAAQVARALGVSLGVAIAAKVGAPGNPEYAIGAVAADGVVTVNRAAGYSADAVEASAGDARAKVAREAARYAAIGDLPTPEGVTAIVVDDGLATGLTAIAAAQWVRRAGASRVVVAAPVAPPSTVRELERYADEVIVLEQPQWFQAVGQFYRVFGQTSDAEVDEVLRRATLAALPYPKGEQPSTVG